MRDRLVRVAPTDLPVLLVGETGTQKKSLALFIHRMSARRWGAFDEIPWVESQLFDPFCEIFGRWTQRSKGRRERSSGRIEACRGGTLLISDIESFPAEVLRGLQRLVTRGVFRARGDLEWSDGVVRLIFSTSRAGEFGPGRSLFGDAKRLEMAVLPIMIPPLRRRADDLEEIVTRMVEESPELGPARIEEQAWALLRRSGFPGNLRQLRAILARASLLAGTDPIQPCHLPEVVDSICRKKSPLPPPEGIIPLAEMRRRYLAWVAGNFEGSRADLARELGVSERALYRRLRESIPRPR